MAKNMQEQQEDNSKGGICYLENICGAERALNVHYRRWLNIDGGKHALAMFLN